jgi:hypothetical protein
LRLLIVVVCCRQQIENRKLQRFRGSCNELRVFVEGPLEQFTMDLSPTGLPQGIRSGRGNQIEQPPAHGLPPDMRTGKSAMVQGK